MYANVRPVCGDTDMRPAGHWPDCWLSPGTPTPALLQQSLNNSFCPFPEPDEHKIIYIIHYNFIIIAFT